MKIKIDYVILDIQFSLGGHQLWAMDCNSNYYFVVLEELENWNSVEKGSDRWITKKITEGDPENGFLLFNWSPFEHSCKLNSGWVVDFQDRKLLWLPHSWRSSQWRDTRWNGNFLALVQSILQEPIIIKFL